MTAIMKIIQHFFARVAQVNKATLAT